MGIVNTTHDSFFSGSCAPTLDDVQALAECHVRSGAQIIDIGGESSRPGSAYVSLEEELSRVVPAVAQVHLNHPSVTISVDTRKEPVARAALDAGAAMVNDISGLRDDPALAALVAERRVPVCIMHMQGTPRTMQENPHYDDVVQDVLRDLARFLQPAKAAGVRDEQIILDPGIGFGKEFAHNWSILRNLERFREPGYPLLIGLSRKRFLGPEQPPQMRLNATLAAQLWCTLQGAAILRVHDVAPMMEMLTVLEAILTAN